MAGRIVLFGATGYTGELTARALVKRGARPVLAARSREKLERLAVEIGGGLETQVADVSDPESVRALVDEGDVMLTTVGPFARWGDAAVEAAIAAKAHYIDSTGEGAFIRRVFEHYGPLADAAGVGLVTAFGYDYVPGNLGCALALEEAGEKATRAVAGYFWVPSGKNGGGSVSGSMMSGGTRASAAGAIMDPAFAFRGGRIVTERGAKRVRSFDVKGKERAGVSIGMTEHFALPRSYPQLTDVETYLGWFGPMSRGMQVQSAVTSVAMKLPPVKMATNAVLGRFVKGSTGGPDAEARSRQRSYFVCSAEDANGTTLAKVRLEGPDGYSYTADMLAWGAIRAAERGLKASGAIGPVEAFGLKELEEGNREVGLERAASGFGLRRRRGRAGERHQ
jgi:short subunit dehydrogenase-like uncharacterized protein